MKIYNTLTEPAIVDFYCDELESIGDDLINIFKYKPYRQDYKDLIVDDKRLTMPYDVKEYNLLKKVIKPSLIQLSKTLVRLDGIRYPIKNHPDLQLFNDKKLGLKVTEDREGFSMPWHIDNRFIIVSGIINVQDNETQTLFSKNHYFWDTGGKNITDDEYNIIHRGQCKKFWGTAWLNTEITEHCVPYVEKDRRIIGFNLHF